MRSIQRALKPVRLRLHLIRLCRGAAWGACAGTALSLLVLVLSFLLPVRHRLPLCGALVAAGVVLTGLVNALRPVSSLTAAKAADRCGLKERLQTALQLTGDSAMERLQREDAHRILHTFHSSAMKLPTMKRQWIGAGAAALACAVLLLIPNPQDAVIARQEAFERRMEEAAARAESAAEQQARADLTDREQQETRRLLMDLSRELRQAEDAMDAMLALDEADKRLEALRDTMAGDRMNALSSAMAAAGMQALAEAMQSDDPQKLAEALEAADAQAMENASAQLPSELQQLLSDVASALQQGDLSAALSQLSQLSQQAQSLSASQLSSLSQLMSSLRSSASGTGSGSGSQSAGQGGSGMNSASAAQSNQLGSGAGRGSTNEEQGGDAADLPGQRGSDAPRYREGIYEAIYDPARLEANQTELSAQSERGEGETVQLQLGPGAGIISGSVPYQQVVLEYASAAVQAADSQSLTRQEQQWVTDYFTALTEE